MFRALLRLFDHLDANMSRKPKEPRVNAPCLRIVLFANLTAMMIYGVIVPHELSKVTAECVTIRIVALDMAVQPYFTASACFSCLPCSFRVAIALNGICVVGWCAAIAFLSYCNLGVVYTPRTATRKHGSSVIVGISIP
jgi:hypothetical protein